MNTENDSLQYLPLEKWEQLERVFEADWPRSISVLAALKTQRHLERIGLGYGFKVYCPNGNPSYGMVALNKKGELNEIIIQCPSDDISKLKESLINTRLINWSNTYLIPYMPENIMQCVNEVAKEINLDIEDEDTVPNQVFVLHKESSSFEIDCLPTDLTFEPITEKDLEIVNSTWRNQYNGSLWLFSMLSKANFGYGLFKNQELISWVFNNEVGALTHLYTIEEYRGKGLAQMLLKRFCNIYLKEGKNIFAYCRKGNTSACKLYEKLGFEMFHEVRWCFLKPGVLCATQDMKQ